MNVTFYHQSPILINRDDALKPPFPEDYLRIDYLGLKDPRPGKYEKLNFVFDPPYVQIFFGRSYWDLREIHVHNHVEHRFDGEAVPHLEVHLIHFGFEDEAMAGPKVVLGVHYRKDDTVEPCDTGLALFAASTKARKANGKRDPGINPADFLPDRPSRWYRYEGSLTSCPFSEDVSWFVMADEKLVNPASTAGLEKQASQPPRKLQDLNQRIVLRSF